MQPELEIYQHLTAFMVMKWDAHRDGGQILRSFRYRSEAIAFAQGVSYATGWPVMGAEILPFDRGVRA